LKLVSLFTKWFGNRAVRDLSRAKLIQEVGEKSMRLFSAAVVSTALCAVVAADPQQQLQSELQSLLTTLT
jgi:hypothetical protein